MISKKILRLGALLGVFCVAGFAAAENGPSITSAGALTFGPGGVLFAADVRAATIFALDLGDAARLGEPGTADVEGIDAKIAAMLGTGASEIIIADMAVDPRTHNTLISVSRGTGAGAQAVLVHVDGAGELRVISLEDVSFTKVTLNNAPDSVEGGRGNPRTESITDMAYVDGKLFIAGLSNEEFASKLRSVPFPFSEADEGTSVEIYHGAHGAFETRSPVYTFVPYEIAGEQNLIAGYLCTPLVKFPVADLKPGAKVRGVTIAELGNRNRPIDMIVYKKDGKDFLLMSNTSRGVMKIPTENFGGQAGITERIADKAGIAYETIASLTGVEQLDLLDEGHALIMVRTDSGSVNLKVIELP